MNYQQALQVIKQTIDAAVKAGIVSNLDHASALVQAWTVLIQSNIKKNEEVQ